MIGRAIRHRNDLGAIILIDSRFSQEKNKFYLSDWVRASLSECDNGRDIPERLREFYVANKQRLGYINSPNFEVDIAMQNDLVQHMDPYSA